MSPSRQPDERRAQQQRLIVERKGKLLVEIPHEAMTEVR